MARFNCILSALLGLAALASGVGAEPARFTQDRFAIGLWVDPPVDDAVERRYNELAEAGFNLVIAHQGAGQPDVQRTILDLAAAHDMRVLLHAGAGDLAALPDGDACWGYSLRDEPNASEFADLRARVDALREARPGKLAYINLFPSYASKEQLGTDTYEEHVSRYMAEVAPDVLCMDHYPIFTDTRDGRDGYCADLAVMRDHSLRAGIPFWNFFNAMPYGPHTNPTLAQMRWQVYASLAHGAKGVLYFCYFTPRGAEFPKGGALVAADGFRTANWYKAQRLNQHLRHLGPTLMRLTSTGVYRIRPGDDPAEILQGQPIRDIQRADVDPPHDYLVGVFRHEDGRRAALLMNYRHTLTAWPTVVFDAPYDDVREVDRWGRGEGPVRDESPDMDGLQVPLEDGAGRLFILP